MSNFNDNNQISNLLEKPQDFFDAYVGVDATKFKAGMEELEKYTLKTDIPLEKHIVEGDGLLSEPKAIVDTNVVTRKMFDWFKDYLARKREEKRQQSWERDRQCIDRFFSNIRGWLGSIDSNELKERAIRAYSYNEQLARFIAYATSSKALDSFNPMDPKIGFYEFIKGIEKKASVLPFIEITDNTITFRKKEIRTSILKLKGSGYDKDKNLEQLETNVKNALESLYNIETNYQEYVNQYNALLKENNPNLRSYYEKLVSWMNITKYVAKSYFEELNNFMYIVYQW